MENIEQQPSDPTNVLLDSDFKIKKIGVFNGSIITKLNDKADSIVFSDSIRIFDETVQIHGLKVGVYNDSASVKNEKFTLERKDILYSVKMVDNIVEEFDKGSLGSNFPYMISFLNSSLLYNYDVIRPVNHFKFVIGEIITHPIALLRNNSIIVGDRIVVDSPDYSVFYNSFMIKRNFKQDFKEHISFSHEPINRIEREKFKYIILLGVEVLK